MASAAFTPRLLPSHSSFCKHMFLSTMSANETPSSSLRPLRLTSRDMQEVLFSIAFVSKRSRTEVSSMPQTVMCGALMLLFKVSKICSKPPSIFFRCSSSSLRLRSCSLLRCSCRCSSFFACCSLCRLSASSFSFSFLRFSAISFLRLRSSILRFCSSSVRRVFGNTATGGLNLRVPRISSSSSSYPAKSSFGASTSTIASNQAPQRPALKLQVSTFNKHRQHQCGTAAHPPLA
mmetsp:Transcript_30360/g.69871  ORF Transcript_30360/g.69871 Transcript_30360/m.69871 type:complete len:234 (-) Transcript_30360:7-708(-)